MKVRIIWTGKTKESYAVEGIRKYLKLLKPVARVEIVEIKEQKSGSMENRLGKEGEKILKQSSAYILLDEGGRELSSVEFADTLSDRAQADFVLGGPYGVSDEVRSAALDTISLSGMTLTHEMARVLLLEQLYRAMTIMKGGSYHH
jgi:23S rRNA (pseudouridine1915-N3)-methyltransferase